MVTELARKENNYQAAFQAVRESSPTVPWLELVRNSAMDKFEQLGFPTVHEENWKYTNLAPIAKQNFVPAVRETNASLDAAPFVYPETEMAHLVVVNGFLSEELSVTTGLENVVAIDLLSAVADERYTKIARAYLARTGGYHNNGLAALNTAFLQSGLFLWIPKGIKVETPIQVTFLMDADQADAASFPRLLVVAEENSSATLIESFVSTRSEEHTSDI